MRSVAAAVLAVLALAGCSVDRNHITDPRLAFSAVPPGGAAVGGVFTETNSTAGNAVVAFARMADGSLAMTGTFPTGGTGIGGTVDPLQSQYAVVLSENAQYLYAVNSGSHEISAFAVGKSGLTWLQTIPSGGMRPVSLATSGHALYALHNVSNTLTGFAVANDGRLTPVTGWNRALPSGADGPAAVRYSRDGHVLAVTERNSKRIDVYPVNDDGSLGTVAANPSSGAVPFGFDFAHRSQLVVSEAGAGAASSYTANADGTLSVVSGSVSTLQAAPCWAIVTGSGRFAYLANAGSGTITGFSIAADGSLSRLNPDGVTGNNGAGSTPLDIDVSRNSRFLYVLKTGTGTIGGFAIGGDGSLTPLADASGLTPLAGFQGLAAY